MSVDELQVDGHGYKDGARAYRLRARVRDGETAIAIHRPADAPRATALIKLDAKGAAALARYLEESRGS
jgi:hypothetical protein